MFCNKCLAFWEGFFSASSIPDSTDASEDVRWAHHSTVLHCSMRELRQSSDEKCVICRSIICLPTQREFRDLLADEDESLEIVLQVDAKDAPFPVLFVTFFDANKAVRLPRRMVATCDGYVKDEDLAATLDRASKLDNSSTGSDASLELAGFWLKKCLNEHENCRQISSVTSTSWIPTRLIDVANDTIRLVETQDAIKEGDDRRYVSLSHCWGKIQIIRTLLANYEDHKKYIAPEQLSKTFREAIHVTRKLGFRYIWIDSLCIIQDSRSDWEAEAATMCDVYRNASLTIAAASAPGGDVGCFEERDGIPQVPLLVDVPPSSTEEKTGAKKHRRLLFTSYARTHSGPAAEAPLYGRSWVLQEQLLSPRMLIFEGLQVRWECNTAHGSERTPLGGMWRLDSHQKVIRTSILNGQEFFTMPDEADIDIAARFRVLDWAHIVMAYTHRGMTQPSDRLVAIDGIAQALSRHTTKRYFAGLWEQDLWLGLLWSISHVNEFSSFTNDAFDIEGNLDVRHADPVAPSWSWASVTVPVVYPVPTLVSLNRMCTILSVSVAGSPARKTGTLTLSAHLRTGYTSALYPYSNRPAARTLPHLTHPNPSGPYRPMHHHGRVFHPLDFFVYSDVAPSRHGSSWHLVRGTFRPDEIISPATQLTFAAIGQWNDGIEPPRLSHTHRDTDPLTVWTLALVPTGRVEGEYRRVGYAVWEDCEWYGYMCGVKERPGRPLKRAEGWKGWAAGWDLEGKKEEGKGKHAHGAEEMDLKRYRAGMEVEERTITIV